MQRAVVVGGSVAGLACALALAREGLQVRVLEQDAEPLPGSAERAFSDWRRRGVPQARHSHALLARLPLLLREREPALLEALLAQGAEEIRFVEVVRQALPGAELLPEDERIALLACRRTTFEWVLRRYVAALPGVELRGGVAVTGLLADPADGAACPRVRGVQSDGARFEADWVVDASGRRSQLRHWLAAIGARRPRVHSEPCGIFYSSRFYRGRAGAPLPSLDGPMGADYGFLKVGVFPGDSRSWSVTLAASPEDPPLRVLTRPAGFEALAAALPLTAPWVDPAVAEPLSAVHSMTGLRNARRFLVEDGEPLALGLAAAGDALIHTNPIAGRGCTLAFVNAYLLADAWRESAGDPRGFALGLEQKVERELVPWYEGMLAQDRDAIRVMRMLRDGEDPYRVSREDGSVDPAAWLRVLLRDGFVPALREDIVVLRAFMRLFNLLDPPAEPLKDPLLLARVLASYARRESRAAVPEPTRAEVVARLAALQPSPDPASGGPLASSPPLEPSR
jgi:2-polyprenyl-6-methoxyphenol hydroxylase-like FAD-dependent oxidoreductase